MTKQAEITVLTESFTYTTANGNTSAQIATYTTVTAAGTTTYTYTYTYDGNGNILSVSDGTYTTSYVYDKQNQLVRVNNQAGNFTHTWAYDNAGNIRTRTEYAYTTGTLGTPTDTVQYTYTDESWGDLLTGYDGTAITYDGIGNPNALDGWSFTWEHGRELATMSNGTTTWTNTYNADGLRTKRTNGSTTYSYVYTGSTLLQMTVGGNTLYFNYDAAGTPLTVTYNGTTYYYATNLQGDIVGILDSTGTAVVSYTYDAWGNPLTTTGTLATTLGTINPLRYRGYVYDIETSLYYLQSRYYNPEIGRFINADDTSYLGIEGKLASYNLFAYCGNNPAMGFDPTGCWDWRSKALFGLGVLTVGVAILLAAPTGGSSLLLGGYALSSITVATAGASLTTVGTVIVVDSLNEANASFAKKSRKSQKEKSTDKPSWVSRNDVDLNKSAQQNAKEIMNNKYGNNIPKGSREFSQIVKWINRSLRDIAIAIALNRLEE